jgi:cytochrome c-type biogenesis protein CcmF
MPWFCATAFLHSAIIQEQKGMMKGWNMILMFLTMFFTIFGTFMTRSGIVQSVHAFGEDNVLALQFVMFLAVMTVVTIGLIVYRWQRLSSKMQFESFMSREFSFLLNNWILLACAFFVLFATMFPTIKESMLGERATVGISFFNKAMPWGGLSLLFLAGAAPLLAWRKTTLDRMKKQFMFPVITMVVIVTGLLLLVPSSRMLTTLTFYAFDVQAPIPIITIGLIVFAFGSISQEFVRGVMVRRKQTGSDAITSLLGLVLTKRRKYGGYIIHLGIAVLFLGFVGKAYDSMIDRTISRSVVSAGLNRDRVPANDPAWFAFQGYKFLYENLQQTSDDHKTATTATVSVWKGGERLTTVFPAQWNFVKGEQPTTEVAIHPRIGEDVYLVLTSYNHETGEANFRVFVNPLINFVWLGFLILAFGTFICLIPASVVNALSPRPRTRLGRAADVTMLVLILGALTVGLVKGASAAELPAASAPEATSPIQLAQAAEHDTGPGMGDGEGFAHKFRPHNDTEATIMKELICMCGGCQRETVFECKCGYAANEREKVQQRIAGYNLSTEAGRERAKAEVMESFVKEYGNEQVLATPRNKAAWMVPVLAAVGGLGLLVFVARTWVVRGRQATIDNKPRATEDETYAEKLDDELANVD